MDERKDRGEVAGKCAAEFRTRWHACAVLFEAELLRVERGSDESGSMVMH